MIHLLSARRHARGDSGMVTAEAAVVLPLVAAVALLLVWLVSLGVAQVQVVDAARDAARSLARGDDEVAAVEAARATAPEGAQVRAARGDETVTVTVEARGQAPGWLLVPLPEMTVRADATVQLEDDDG